MTFPSRLLGRFTGKLTAFSVLSLPGGESNLEAAKSGWWTFPTVVGASMTIAWAAEAAQFLFSQGLALAVVAWLQTIPEFAVEILIAWKRQVALMTASLTGAIRLLIGLGWPMIYVTASIFYRREAHRRLRAIHLDPEHAVEVVFLAPPVLYFVVIAAKKSFSILDGIILLVWYFFYLWVLKKIPPKSEEKIAEMDLIPRSILLSRPVWRNFWIVVLFLGGGVLMYVVVEPFVSSMLAMAAWLGVSQYVLVQWVAPLLSEFPEKVSAFYWARTVRKANMAMMNMVSSNVNQWTVLAATLPFVYALSLWHHGLPVQSVPLDAEQQLEILLTVAQSLVGLLVLANLSFHRNEAIGIFVLWFVQFFVSVLPAQKLFPTQPSAFFIGLRWAVAHTHLLVTIIYFVWAGVLIARMAAKRELWIALKTFARLWREHVKA